jgi:hypothetical protein
VEDLFRTDGEQWVAYCGTVDGVQGRQTETIPLYPGAGDPPSVFCTGIPLLTIHASTGECSARSLRPPALPVRGTSPNHSPDHNSVPTLHPREATTPYLSYLCPTISAPRKGEKPGLFIAATQPGWATPPSPGGYG